MKSKCPNINDKEYKSLASIVGSGRAHTIYDMNNGNPVSLTADGNPSLIYQQLVERHGIDKAVDMRSKMFTNRYQILAANSTSEILDQNDNIIMSDGTMVQLGDKVEENEAVSDYKLLREYVETAQTTEALVSTLERSIPGFNINIESHETVQDTIHKNDRAWVDKEGVHLNTQTMHYDTPIHEVTHLWIHALEMTDITKYNQFMDKIIDSVKYNKEIMDTIKRKYPELDETRQLYEYAAALSGMVSAKHVRKFLSRNNRYATDKRINEIYQNEKGTIQDFYVNVGQEVSKKVLDNNEQSSLENINFETGTLNDIFQALTNDILDGKRVINFGPEEVQQLLSKYYSNNDFEASKGFDKITNIKQITPYLIGTDTISDDTDKMVDYIFDRLQPHGKRPQKIFYDYGKPFYFPNNQPESEVRRRINDEIISRRKTLLASFNDNIVEIINLHLMPENRFVPFEELIAQVFSNYDFSDTVVDNIVRSLKVLGIDEPMTRVMNYSSLEKNHDLSFLYNAALVGHNPLVIQHTDSKDKIDISVIDLTGSILGWEENQTEKHEKFLADNLGYSKSVNKDKTKVRAFDMANNQGDIRQVLIATTISGMNKLAQEKGKKLSLRRFGVIGFDGHTVRPHMISSIQKAMVNARDVFTLPAIQNQLEQNSLSYNWFQELLGDDKAWNEDSIQQRWVDALETYYSSFYQQLGLNELQKESLLSEVNSETHYMRIKERARQIERTNSNWINSPEHKLLTRFIMQHETGIHSVAKSQVTDIDKTFMKVTNVHNIKSDVLQNYSIQAENDKTIIVDQVNKYKKEFKTLLEKSLESRGKSIKMFGNTSEDMYKHLFKDGELLLQEDHKDYKANQLVKVKLFNQLYGSHNIKEAKAAGLTNEDIALADFIYNTVKERYVQNALHQNSKKSNPSDVTKLREEIDGNMIPGNIPVLDATEIELIREGKIKESLRKGYDSIAISELMTGMEDISMDNDLSNKDYQYIHSRFASQATMQQQMRMMGLSNTQSENRFEGKMKFYENHTYNLERVFNLFVDDSIRMIELENRTIPAFNTATQWMKILEEEYNINQENTQKFLQQYVNRTMLNRTEDSPTDKLAHFVRNVTQAYSFISLGGRPLVWIRSAYFNTQAQIVEQLTVSATNRLLSEGTVLDMPSTSDMAKANLEVALHHNKTLAIARKLGMVDGSEMEAIESFFLTNTDKHLFKSEIAHVGNYYTDRFARIVSMVAFMIHDGSYDAHSFNEQTGELSYDKTKDRRFHDASGKIKGPKEEAIWKRKQEEMKSSNLVNDDGSMEVGYSFKEANTRFKYYVDKYIIGAMDPYQKLLLGNTYAGRSVTQFRTFLPGKLANVLMSERKTLYGAQMTAVQNEDGEWEAINQQLKVVGALPAIANLLKDVYKVSTTKDLHFKDLERLDPMVEYALVKSVIKSMMFISIMSAIYLLGKGLSDRDKDKLSWTFSELMSYSSYEQIKKNIIPITGLIDTIMGLLTGAKWTTSLKYLGPFYDGIFFVELFGNRDNLMKDWTARKKISEMELEEKQEYYNQLLEKRLKDAERERQKELNND